MSVPGTLLQDRYRLLRAMGDDGDATRWEAHDAALGRPVVVKLLRSARGADPLAAERFRQAARAAARTTPATGGRILDAGDDAATGLPFVVVEPPADVLPVTTKLRLPPAPAPTRTRADIGLAPPTQPRQRERRSRAPLWLLLAAAALVLGVVALRPALVGRDAANPPLPTTADARPSPAAAESGAPATPAARLPSPTPAGGHGRYRVVNTDGRGVALRATAGGDRLPGKGYDEGATVTLLEQRGDWAHIRGDDGREGWVLAVTLAP